MKIKVTVADYIEQDLNWEAEQLARRGVELAVHQLWHAPTQEVIAATRDADVVIVNHVPVTPELIAGWQKCRLVIRHGTGYDNLDVAALERAGISTCYVPDYCIEEVAEHAIALLFALGRRLPAADRVFDISEARDQWDFAPIIPVHRMAGRTLGIIGCGRIGSRVHQKLLAFGFRHIICDPYLSEERKAELGIHCTAQEQLFREADFITIHTPLTEETRSLINQASLSLMKPTAFLVNTARGPIVDSQALAAALRERRIAGAALDVFEKEPLGRNSPLMGLPNLILTPHCAWYSEESAQRIREIILLEIDRFLEGLPPRFSPIAAQPQQQRGALP